MRITSRTSALFALVITAGCAAPLDESTDEPGPTDAGADARRPGSQDAGGAGGSGGGGWGGSGGSGGEGGDLDAGDDVELDADLDADTDPDADVDASDAGEVCLPPDAVIDPECGLCGDPLFGCAFGCLIVDCPNDSTMMCNALCQCAPTPPPCSDPIEDGGVDDDASAPDADVDGGPDDDAGLEDAGESDADADDAGDWDGSLEDADIDDAGESDGSLEDADVDDAGESDGSFEDAAPEDADVEDADTEDA